MSCGAELEAKVLLTSLVDPDDFEIPNISLNQDAYKLPGTNTIRDVVKRVLITDLTTGEVGGTGVFDKLMSSVRAHIKEEYDKNRITGAEYSKTYTELTAAAMNTSVQFLLGRDDAFWKAQLSQIQAITGHVELEQSKLAYAKIRLDAHTAKAGYALTMLKMSSESVAYCLSKNELDTLRPLQISNLTLDMETKTYTLENMLPRQLSNLVIQGEAAKEQMESVRAQTLDTRTNGAVVVGVLCKQKSLYSQQVVSYQRDSEVKAAKLFTDAWITQKTIDEGLLPPNGFNNASVDTVLTKLKNENGFF